MEDAGTSEEDDDIESQDSNTPIGHGNLAWNCSMKIITPTVKASVISLYIQLNEESYKIPNTKFLILQVIIFFLSYAF